MLTGELKRLAVASPYGNLNFISVFAFVVLKLSMKCKRNVYVYKSAV